MSHIFNMLIFREFSINININHWNFTTRSYNGYGQNTVFVNLQNLFTCQRRHEIYTWIFHSRYVDVLFVGTGTFSGRTRSIFFQNYHGTYLTPAFCLLQILHGDGMPDFICLQCLRQINKSFNFKQLCEKSDAILKHYILEGLLPAEFQVNFYHFRCICT